MTTSPTPPREEKWRRRLMDVLAAEEILFGVCIFLVFSGHVAPRDTTGATGIMTTMSVVGPFMLWCIARTVLQIFGNTHKPEDLSWGEWMYELVTSVFPFAVGTVVLYWNSRAYAEKEWWEWYSSWIAAAILLTTLIDLFYPATRFLKRVREAQ